MPRILCIGETMVQVTPSRGGRISTDTDFRLVAGGAESNVAAMLAKLGVPSTWIGAVGADPFGEIIRRSLEQDGVDTSFVRVDESSKTAVYFKDVLPESTKVFYYRESSAMSAAGPELLDVVASQTWDVIHLSGITPALSANCENLTRQAIEDGKFGAALKSFDINYRPSLWPEGKAAPILQELANHCDVVFVGLDEATALWGSQTAEDVRAVLPNPRWLVVKDSENSATEINQEGIWAEPAIEVNIVEKVGAGDAFAAGWLASFLKNQPANLRLRTGHIMAAQVLKTHTDTANPPTPDELAEALKLGNEEGKFAVPKDV